MSNRAEFLNGPFVALWFIPAVFALATLIGTRRGDIGTRRGTLMIVRFVILAYLVAIVIITLWPLTFDASVARVENGNWAPLQGTLGFLISSNETQQRLGGVDVLANVALFAPLALLIPYGFYQWQGIFVAILALAFLAFGLELFQGFTIAERTFDIDDAIAGFVGGTLATLVAGMLRPILGPT